MQVLVEELCRLTDFSFQLESDNDVVDVVKSEFSVYTMYTKKSLSRYSTLTTEHLKSGEFKDSLNVVEFIAELAQLLLDEFGHNLEAHVEKWASQICTLCQKIRHEINETLSLPLESPLVFRQSNLLRYPVSIDLYTILCSPVVEMIATIKRLLISENLNASQREDLNISLENSRIMYGVVQLMLILIKRQSFDALRTICHSYHSPFGTMISYFRVLAELDADNLQKPQMEDLRKLENLTTLIFRYLQDLLEVAIFIGGLTSRWLNTRPISLSDYSKYIDSRLADLVQKYPHLSIQSAMPEALPDFSVAFSSKSIAHQLFENATKYTQTGSISINADLQDTFFVISIADTGIGIPESHLEYIFEPFTQVDEQKKGLGIGLYLVRQYVEKAGGSIAVESQLGQGSKFTVKLPLISPSETSPL